MEPAYPLYLIGNAHIDPVWLWQWREGFHEVKATFRSALDRMEETSGFVFTCACACYYQWVEENDPAMFREIQARVREGRWVIVGGMWIQPDMNIPSGESLARQTLLSQRYFLEKFGRTATVGYLVDSFGHNAMTPQLLARAGMTRYVWMRPSVQENPAIPEGPMRWASPDGSEVTAYRIAREYTTRAQALPRKMDELFAFSQRLSLPVLCFYGVGNHGGGPTRANLRQIAAYQKENEKGPWARFGSPEDYFRLLAPLEGRLPRWAGELQHHASGCYSTHARTKRLHRRAENALLRMEALGALAQGLTGHRLKAPFVRQAWENLLFNEFHDLMGGCCEEAALLYCETQLQEALSIADREENAAIQRISWQIDTARGLADPTRSKEGDWKLWGAPGQGTPVAVFNPHGFPAEGTVRIRRPLTAVRDEAGRPCPCQRVRAGRTNGDDCQDGIFRARVPALGYRLYWVHLAPDAEDAAPESALRVWETGLENELLRAEFDPKTGALTRLTDKRTGRNALTGPARARLMNIEACDTWAHGVFRFDQAAGEFSGARFQALECGPVRAALRVTTGFGASELEQIYVLYAGADQLEVEARLDLREKFRMVKLCFPTGAARDFAEIPAGVLPREADGLEQPCQRFVAMQEAEGGLAAVNDGKYSYSAQNGELRLTIANSSLFADHYGQARRDDTCRFMDQGEQRFRYALVPYAGPWQGAALHERAALLNRPLPAVEETYHAGPLPAVYEGVSIDTPAVGLTALKRAEDGKGFVARFAEQFGRQSCARAELPLLNRTLALRFSPFEMKTVYLPDDPGQPPEERLLTELPLCRKEE